MANYTANTNWTYYTINGASIRGMRYYSYEMPKEYYIKKEATKKIRSLFKGENDRC